MERAAGAGVKEDVDKGAEPAGGSGFAFLMDMFLGGFSVGSARGRVQGQRRAVFVPERAQNLGVLDVGPLARSRFV